MGGGFSSSLVEADSVAGANATLRKDMRIQTIWDEAEGDNRWYVGTVIACYTNGHAKVKYDDDDSWRGDARDIYALKPGHPGLTQVVRVGCVSMDGHPGMTTQGVNISSQQQQQQQSMMPPTVIGQPVATAVAYRPS